MGAQQRLKGINDLKVDSFNEEENGLDLKIVGSFLSLSFSCPPGSLL